MVFDTPTLAHSTAHEQKVGDNSALLRPGHNVWRKERANRAAILVDAAAYYGALRDALKQAHHSIYIVGWDVDSRTRLVGESGNAADYLPEELGDFLDALVRQRPSLKIRILLWDYSVFFADEREPLPSLALRWKRMPQIDLCFDATVPLGAAHHQKIVVIDDSIAFCGGLDLTIRRWDNQHHCAHNPERCDPAGKTYPPFHDVQAMVDGPAAAALGKLVKARWARAAYEVPGTLSAGKCLWPESVVANFHQIDVGIARTLPAFEESTEVREVENLFIDMIRKAQKCIYIESQYLTLTPVADAIAQQLNKVTSLEVIIVCPSSYHGIIERQAMLPGRSEFIRQLEDCNAASRWVVLSPCASDDRRLNVSLHSKVMIVDNTYLRVGSANLCHRSMATDSECDLVFVAGDLRASAEIDRVKLSLIAEHCGCNVKQLTTAIRRQGSIVKAIYTIIARSHGAQFIHAENEPAPIPFLKSIADPKQPITMSHFGGPSLGWFKNRIAAWVLFMVMLIGFSTLAAAWGISSIGQGTGAFDIESSLIAPDSAIAGFIVMTIFVVAGLVAFPLVVLIIATVATFGLWPGLGYAAAGAMTSAVTTYAIGRWLGNKALRRFFGPRLNRISAAFIKRGVMAVTVIRLIPGAPYTLINLAAGALRIHPIDYVIGTALGLAPGFAMMALLGRQIIDVIRNPSLLGISLLFIILLVSIGLSFTLQHLISMWRRRNR